MMMVGDEISSHLKGLQMMTRKIVGCWVVVVDVSVVVVMEEEVVVFSSLLSLEERTL